MFTVARDTEYVKLESNIPTIPDNNENFPLNDQNDSKSINSAKSVTLADSKSKLAGSKIKAARSKLKESTEEIETEEEKECEDATRLSCMTELEASFVVTDYLSKDYSRQDSDSDFGEVECGEPTVTSKLTIDFTMSPNDTDFVQKKCCDFWKFIYSNPHLQNLKVIPEPDEDPKLQQGESVSSPSASIPRATAIDILQKDEKKVPQAFTAKQPVICLDQDNRAYCHGSCARLDKEMMELRQEKSKVRSKKRPSSIDTKSSTLLTNLCSELDAWDLQHPKSFDPPTLVPWSSSSESSAQALSASPMKPKEPECTSDMMCVTCSHSPEDRLKVDQIHLEVRAEE